MAVARKQDIDLGITRLEYGEKCRERRAVLQIETSKYYNGGLISDADVYWVGASSRQRMVSLGTDGGDYSKRLKVSAKDVRATQGAIDRQHTEIFTAEVIAGLMQAAKDHYAAVVRAGFDAYKNIYPRQVVADGVEPVFAEEAQMTTLTKAQIAEINETYSIDPEPTIYYAGGEPIGAKYTAHAHIDDDGAVDDIQRSVGPAWKVEWSGNSNTEADGNTEGDIDITLIADGDAR